MKKAVAWDDFPAGGRVPSQENLPAVVVWPGVVIELRWKYQMGRRRTCREERIPWLESLEMLIKTGENRDIQRQSLTNLRAIAGLIIVELLGLGIGRTKYF